MNYNIQEIRKEANSLSEEERARIANGLGFSNNAILRSTTYNCPLIIARYWRPALIKHAKNAAACLDYAAYKIYAYGKDQSNEPEPISYSQFLYGTSTKLPDGRVIHHDHGAGTSEAQLPYALLLLEALSIMDAHRSITPKSGAKETTKYSLVVVNEFSALTEDQQIAFMATDPFTKVLSTIALLKNKGLYIP
jgi:hypothetical protein